MPLRPVLGALGAAAAAVLTLGTPATAAPDANLTIDQTARLSADGTVTVYGTYRCFDANGLVFVGAAISQDPSATRYGIGGTRAVCDGAYHRWHNSGTVTPNRLTPARPASRPPSSNSAPTAACPCPTSTPHAIGTWYWSQTEPTPGCPAPAGAGQPRYPVRTLGVRTGHGQGRPVSCRRPP